MLPDVLTTGFIRDFLLEFTPGDPYPTWDFTGAPQGDAPATGAVGAATNIRDPEGGSLREETARAFAAVRITNEPTIP